MAPPTIVDRELMLKLHEEGLNNSEIGRRLGCSRERIRQLLGSKSRRKPIVDLIDVDTIRQRLEAGSTLAQLIEEFDTQTIYGIIDNIEGGRELAERNLQRMRAARLEAKADYWRSHSPVGKLTIASVYREPGSPIVYADCVCECGRKHRPQLRHIREGLTMSCGKGGCHMNHNPEVKAIRERAIALGKGEPKFSYPRSRDE